MCPIGLVCKDQRGAITLGLVIMAFFAALALAGSVALSGTGTLLSGYQAQTSERALVFADSCLAEALLRLKNNSNYPGGSLSAGADSCIISISGAGGSRTIDITATSRRTIRKITAAVTLSSDAVSLDTWSENTN